jgi:hypothetical protein
LQDAIREVVKAQSQLVGAECQVNALLGCDLQRCAGFCGVLGRQSCASTNGVLVRQANFQGVTNLCSRLGEAIVIF